MELIIVAVAILAAFLVGFRLGVLSAARHILKALGLPKGKVRYRSLPPDHPPGWNNLSEKEKRKYRVQRGESE